MPQKTLAAREARLAYLMLAPTVLIVFAIVLFPVLANFWISVKPITLGDLRSPTPVVRERLLSSPEEPGGTFRVRYQMRNSSQSVPIADVVLRDSLLPGLTLVDGGEACEITGDRLTCRLGDWEGGQRQNLELEFALPESVLPSEGELTGTEPQMRGRARNVLTDLTFTLDNFRRAITGADFMRVLGTSLAYTVFGTLGSIILGIFAAQLLNSRFRGQGLLRGLFLFPYVAPVIAGAFTWVFMLDPLGGSVNALGVQSGLFNEPISFLSQRSFDIHFFGLVFAFPLALTVVIAFEVWRYFPFAFLFVLARLQAIPQDMYEAAEVDGASPLQRFWHLTLPQLIGVLSTLFLLRFIWIFNKFDDIFLLTGGAAGTKTLPVQVYDQAFALSDIGAGSAVAVILFAILAVFIALYFRFVPEEA